MEENKNLNEISAEEIENEQAVTEETNTSKPKKKMFALKRSTKIKNQALFKRGSYSIAITAVVLAALILFNWMVSALSERFHIEFDMSAEKVNTINEENLDYIKTITDEVDVVVCAGEADYTSYMSYYSQNYYSAEANTDYFDQTISLINKYAEYNDKITVRYIDPQSTEFTEISTKYKNAGLSYGDVIVSAVKTAADGSENERYKKIAFTDIYNLADNSGYAAMGYGSYTIDSNNIETALTSAISYVTTSKAKKMALITGHSSSSNTEAYTTLLKTNNYEIDLISDSIISEISSDYDVVAVLGPTIDFVGSELDAISEFLENGGKLNKGFLFFADATAPNLPNLYEFLSEWGIEITPGIVFETDSNNHIDGDPTTMGIYPAEDSITDDMTYCITGYNIPMSEGEPAESTTTVVTEIFTTSETVVAAPVGSSAEWNDYTEDDKGKYLSVVQSDKSDYDDHNNEIRSYVIAFASIDYINSDWAEYSQLSNKDITLAMADRASFVEDSGISFLSKTITNESYADKITESGSLTVRIIFMAILPIAVIVAGIYIFIRRKNA